MVLKLPNLYVEPYNLDVDTPFYCRIYVVGPIDAERYWIDGMGILEFLRVANPDRILSRLNRAHRRTWDQLRRSYNLGENVEDNWSPDHVFLSEAGLKGVAKQLADDEKTVQLCVWLFKSTLPLIRRGRREARDNDLHRVLGVLVHMLSDRRYG